MKTMVLLTAMMVIIQMMTTKTTIMMVNQEVPSASARLYFYSFSNEPRRTGFVCRLFDKLHGTLHHAQYLTVKLSSGCINPTFSNLCIKYYRKSLWSVHNSKLRSLKALLSPACLSMIGEDLYSNPLISSIPCHCGRGGLHTLPPGVCGVL